jgi:DNA-binding LacI/PurR family transcriptional regulator
VAQPRELLVDRGLELLLARMNDEDGERPPRHVALAPSLVVRGSTAAPRTP